MYIFGFTQVLSNLQIFHEAMFEIFFEFLGELLVRIGRFYLFNFSTTENFLEF